MASARSWPKTSASTVDILVVPGGFGTTEAIANPEARGFLGDRGRTARYITSVCTGSLVLGTAGSLDGYRAAVHWGFREFLKPLGAERSTERVGAATVSPSRVPIRGAEGYARARS
ncbi:DJ-1/PfpI family protein [Pseudonocardia spinosispora]|uniref:DJ-1/PfpI family protein n=1 Tax=Pseudonocardia spinosispora TaxID=103441 RepID=UPI0003FA8180|nr:DJ-1/PfpI family protein [Pseudonocardia spinosispora]